MSDYHATFSTPLLNALIENGISVIFSSLKGEWKGMLCPFGMTSQIKRRSLQEEVLKNAPFRYHLSLRLMEAKIANSSTFLLLLSKRVPSDKRTLLQEKSQDIKEMKKLLYKETEDYDLSFLLGIEGKVANLYWQALRESSLFPDSFKGRVKHTQAQDEVNLALNYAYTLLLRDIAQVLSSTALDPSLGFYHEPFRDRPSLICDLMEDLRAWVVDRFVLKNLSHLQKEGNLLSPESLRVLRKKWQEEGSEPLAYLKEKKTLEKLLFSKVHSLVKCYYHREVNFYETTFFKKW